MARSKDVNKSQAIKDYLVEHPDAAPKETSLALNEQGIQVTPAYVSTIKSTMKRPARGGGRRKAAADSGISWSDLVEAKKLAVQLGGIDRARKAMEALSSLSE